ncbi:MAG: DUF2460 domain-containing protein, partial [Promethearchaeota archaeon]
MGEISKELKIVILANVAAGLIYGILQLFFTDAYLTMIEHPTPDVHFTRISGGTLFVLSIFGIYTVLKKDWSDFKSIDPLGVTTDNDSVFGYGDGATTDFQLKKEYISGVDTQLRT